MSEESYKRKLVAILSADVEGYSRLMGDDEVETIRTLTVYRTIISNLVNEYRGRVVDEPGDNILSEFASVVDAVNCSVKIQQELAQKNTGFTDDRKMQFRIGINLGDVIDEGGRIYGDGVNIAARVEAMAEAGGICISGRAYDQVENKLDLEYDYLGEHQVKNIRRPIRVYRVKTTNGVLESVSSEDQTVLKLPDKPSIAVLPFDNMSGDPEQEYFSDGITEDIITALSRSPWLFVISRNSSFFYRGTAVDVKKVSRELGVRYILEGSVRKAGNRVRVTAQLIDGIEGNHMWAEKYDGELEDIFDLQDQITQQVVASIQTQIQMYVSEKAVQPDHPDVVTWDLLARGWKLFYQLTEDGLSAAEVIFRNAIATDPNSCNANHLLASTIIHRAEMGYSHDIKESLSEANYYAKRAVELDESNEYAHWTLGLIQLWQKKHDLATAELKRAIEINPNCSLAYGTLGTVLSYSGEPDESIRNNEIAIRANPRDVSIFFRYSGLAMAHFVADRYAEAVRWARKSVHRKPNWRVAHVVLIAGLGQLDLLEEAKEAMNHYLECIPGETVSELRSLLPFKRSDDARRLEEGLLKAGMPE